MWRFRLFLGRFGEGIFLYKKRREFVVYNFQTTEKKFLKKSKNQVQNRKAVKPFFRGQGHCNLEAGIASLMSVRP